MLLSADRSRNIATFNKHDLDLQWPWIWVLIIGIIMIILTFCIAGMEVGHTIYDLRRSTAFGGFITFLPLLICAVLVIVTAFKPRLFLIRIAIIVCFLMIFLCMVLIAYDILVEIDPTRCFFLDCSAATINASNSTTNIIVSGWPVYISWPSAFQTSMNAKRIFQGIQIALSATYILFAALYILTCFIYRRVNLFQKSVYSAGPRRTGNHDQRLTSSKHSNHVAPLQNSHGHITTYMITGEQVPLTKHPHSSSAATTTKSHHTPSAAPTPTKYRHTPSAAPTPTKYRHTPSAAPTPTVTQSLVSRKTTKPKSANRPRANSVTYDRICTRCLQEPRMVLTTSFERQNYFSHLCANCNNDMVSFRRKGTGRASASRIWRH